MIKMVILENIDKSYQFCGFEFLRGLDLTLTPILSRHCPDFKIRDVLWQFLYMIVTVSWNVFWLYEGRNRRSGHLQRFETYSKRME